MPGHGGDQYVWMRVRVRRETLQMRRRIYSIRRATFTFLGELCQHLHLLNLLAALLALQLLEPLLEEVRVDSISGFGGDAVVVLQIPGDGMIPFSNLTACKTRRSFGRTLPVRTPLARGEYTVVPMEYFW